MLIDFADALNHRDVYELGHTFLRLCSVLNLQLPVIEPELFIRRFVAKLEFEEKSNIVYNTAVRIVQRMRRDWIQTGRRPAGLCGASLLIAARIHGFRRTPQEINQVVRVSIATLQKRVSEFNLTPIASLTPEEFTQLDTEIEHEQSTLPPSLTPKSTRRRKSSGQLAATLIDPELIGDPEGFTPLDDNLDEAEQVAMNQSTLSQPLDPSAFLAMSMSSSPTTSSSSTSSSITTTSSSSSLSSNTINSTNTITTTNQSIPSENAA